MKKLFVLNKIKTSIFQNNNNKSASISTQKAPIFKKPNFGFSITKLEQCSFRHKDLNAGDFSDLY